ncbi:MAG: hypothetical protein AABY32_04270 [Nanoarchaeota archaeon]
MPIAERPTLENLSKEELAPLTPETKNKIIKNFDNLLIYGKQNESSLKSYNDYATLNNKSSEAYDKIK